MTVAGHGPIMVASNFMHSMDCRIIRCFIRKGPQN